MDTLVFSRIRIALLEFFSMLLVFIFPFYYFTYFFTENFSMAANRAEEIKEMWRLRQKEQELDNRLKGRLRDDSSSDRSRRDTSESRRSTSKRLSDREGTDSASRMSKREIQDLSPREEKGLRDEEIEEFLQSRLVALSLSLCI